MIIAIIACEVAFWIFLTLGLIARYPLNKPRLGLAFLYSTPLVDIVLLTLVIIHVRGGAEPHFSHGIAALYLGFSVAFGHQTIAWADRVYRRRINKEQVAEPHKGSKLRQEFTIFARAVLAAAIAAGVIELIGFLATSPNAVEVFRQWHRTLLIILGIWFVTGPVWQLFAPASTTAHQPVPQPAHTSTPNTEPQEMRART